MIHNETKVRRGEAVYCLTVSVSAIALIAAVIIGKRPWIVPALEYLPLALAAFFPVGMAMLDSRRMASPRAVLGCIVLTGLFFVMILLAVLRRGP